MDLETLGAGGASGFIAAVLTLLGWNKRISDLERSQVGAKVCAEKHAKVDAAAEEIKEELRYIRVRVDKLIDLQLNGRGGH